MSQYCKHLNYFQGRVKNGFFVEAGADDFVHGSNRWSFQIFDNFDNFEYESSEIKKAIKKVKDFKPSQEVN